MGYPVLLVKLRNYVALGNNIGCTCRPCRQARGEWTEVEVPKADLDDTLYETMLVDNEALPATLALLNGHYSPPYPNSPK